MASATRESVSSAVKACATFAREGPDVGADDVKRGAPVLSNFNKVDKLDPGSFRVWMSLLRRLPGALLWTLQPKSGAAAAVFRVRGPPCPRLARACRRLPSPTETPPPPPGQSVPRGCGVGRAPVSPPRGPAREQAEAHGAHGAASVAVRGLLRVWRPQHSSGRAAGRPAPPHPAGRLLPQVGAFTSRDPPRSQHTRTHAHTCTPTPPAAAWPRRSSPPPACLRWSRTARGSTRTSLVRPRGILAPRPTPAYPPPLSPS